MTDSFLGEIRMFGGNFAPRGWALCDGQLLAIIDNGALFSLLGDRYGGDGRTNFGLPDLRGRIPVHYGQGIGLSNYPLGARYGVEEVRITEAQLPNHSHSFQVSENDGGSTDPNAGVLANQENAEKQILFYKNKNPTDSMMDSTVSSAGENQPHYNLQPYLCVNFIIALAGNYPPRN